MRRIDVMWYLKLRSQIPIFGVEVDDRSVGAATRTSFVLFIRAPHLQDPFSPPPTFVNWREECARKTWSKVRISPLFDSAWQSERVCNSALVSSISKRFLDSSRVSQRGTNSIQISV